ncbi:hypothetical protein OHA70_05280 [Kribbella sp. NBC_00382]|uniref:hypothetical protein n=1 Tax=Kribbella sp. NBC_00382 TaxID=2975967 RepID=UPI002E1CB6B0
MPTDAALTYCPQCGHQLPSDPRYVTWCDRCDWNVDPNPQEHDPTWHLQVEPVTTAPSLYAVLRELTTATRTRPIKTVAVTTLPRISITRRALRIGLPLWAGLEPQQRLAVLAHELYDARRGWHSEWRTDLRVAKLVGSDAAATALERSLLAGTTYQSLARALRFNPSLDPLEALRRSAAPLPAHELTRRLRLAVLHNTRSDPAHPPTHLRTHRIRLADLQGTLELTDAENAAIDRELQLPATTALAAVRD